MKLCRLCTEDNEREAHIFYRSHYWLLYAEYYNQEEYCCRLILKRHATALQDISVIEREEVFKVLEKISLFAENSSYEQINSSCKNNPHLTLEAVFVGRSCDATHPCNPGIQLMSSAELLQLFKDRLRKHLLT